MAGSETTPEPTTPTSSTRSSHKDIRPDLLLESGRASAAQDMVDVATEISDRAQALEDAIVDALAAQLKRWRRAAIVMAVAFSLLLISSISNHVALDKVSHTNDNVNEVVNFVRCIRDQVDIKVCFPHSTQPTTTLTH